MSEAARPRGTRSRGYPPTGTSVDLLLLVSIHPTLRGCCFRSATRHIGRFPGAIRPAAATSAPTASRCRVIPPSLERSRLPFDKITAFPMRGAGALLVACFAALSAAATASVGPSITSLGAVPGYSSPTKAAVEFDFDDSGTCSAVAVAAGADAPSVAQIMDGTDSTGAAALATSAVYPAAAALGRFQQQVRSLAVASPDAASRGARGARGARASRAADLYASLLSRLLVR